MQHMRLFSGAYIILKITGKPKNLEAALQRLQPDEILIFLRGERWDAQGRQCGVRNLCSAQVRWAQPDARNVLYDDWLLGRELCETFWRRSPLLATCPTRIRF